MIALSLQNATLSFDETVQLGPIDLDIEVTGVTAILGPNGAGKSLFLSLCHGMLPSQTGTVQWNETDAAATRATRGYMLQTPVVLRRTVAANIDFALRSHAVPASERGTKVSRALTRARLSDKAQTPAATLSGGELRRMNLARALVTEPDVLILDEPFAGLDPAASQAMEAIISEAAETTPILMSHHDLVQTRRLADRVLFFNDGKLVENTIAHDFFTNPQTNQATTFLKGQLL